MIWDFKINDEMRGKCNLIKMTQNVNSIRQIWNNVYVNQPENNLLLHSCRSSYFSCMIVNFHVSTIAESCPYTWTSQVIVITWINVTISGLLPNNLACVCWWQLTLWQPIYSPFPIALWSCLFINVEDIPCTALGSSCYVVAFYALLQ